MSTRVLVVTGASGFVGSAVCRLAVEEGHEVRGITRSAARPLAEGVVRHVVPGLGPNEELATAMDGAHAVIHLAARVHVMRETAADPDAAFREVNVDGTLALTYAAQAAGVRRMVYASSIKVNGEGTRPGQPYRESDAPAPQDAYGRSKLLAEQALAASTKDGPEVVVVRPPLVYGPGVGGNILRLMQLIQRGVPLPLGGIRNQRSLIGVRNLARLLLLAATHPRAAGETFLAADGQDLSTPELVRQLAQGLWRPARLITVPAPVFSMLAALPPARGVVARLTGSLQVDASKARRLLGWRPDVPVAEGLQETARAFKAAS